MSFFCRNDRKLCTVIAIAVSAITGIAVAFVEMSGGIVLSGIYYAALLAVAMLYMPVTMVVAAITYSHSRNLRNTPALFTQMLSIIGSILLSVIAILVGTAASAVATTVIAGFYAFFFALLFTSTACIIKFLANGNER